MQLCHVDVDIDVVSEQPTRTYQIQGREHSDYMNLIRGPGDTEPYSPSPSEP